MDCSGFTSAVFADLGVYLPDSPGARYAYGVPSSAKAGDLVFLRRVRLRHLARRHSHRLRTVIHASTYYGAVVETPMEYIPGYIGAVDAY